MKRQCDGQLLLCSRSIFKWVHFQPRNLTIHSSKFQCYYTGKMTNHNFEKTTCLLHNIPVGMPSSFDPRPKPFTMVPTLKCGNLLLPIVRITAN